MCILFWKSAQFDYCRKLKMSVIRSWRNVLDYERCPVNSTWHCVGIFFTSHISPQKNGYLSKCLEMLKFQYIYIKKVNLIYNILKCMSFNKSWFVCIILDKRKTTTEMLDFLFGDFELFVQYKKYRRLSQMHPTDSSLRQRYASDLARVQASVSKIQNDAKKKPS